MSSKFAVFDIDGTLIRWQLYHALVDELARTGSVSESMHAAVRQARMDWKRRSYEDAFRSYEQIVVGAYEDALGSLKPEQLDVAVRAVIDEYQDQTYAFTRQLLTSLKAKGYLLFAISGSQKELVSHIAEHYGFDDFVGTDYVQSEGRFTGEKIFNASNKRKVLEDLIAKHECSLGDSVGVGDSMGDVPMLEVVEQPIAFNPEKQLLEHAKKHHWKIVLERKNVIYELEASADSYMLS